MDALPFSTVHHLPGKNSNLTGVGEPAPLTESVSKETNLFIEDAVKLKDGIVGGTGKVISGTVETGSKITSGISSFFKGMFSSEN